MSLRAKLLIFFIILALIPLGLASRSMIRITRDELKSSANDRLITVATQVVNDIEEFHTYVLLMPLIIVKNSVEDENLGVNEKLSLLMEGMKSMDEFVALQITVAGAEEPLLVVQKKVCRQAPRGKIRSQSIPDDLS